MLDFRLDSWGHRDETDKIPDYRKHSFLLEKRYH